MGNCQAVDAAALVIQHPSGKLERMYWPLTAGEVMKLNPGHHVSLIIPLPAPDEDAGAVRFTRVKLLRPTDTLVLGRAYRLITNQEVMKVLKAKKSAKMKKKISSENLQQQRPCGEEEEDEALKSGPAERINQAKRCERQRARSGQPSNAAGGSSKQWRPSLQSISESVS
ncbi:unnamed protein product [Cuscuta campestris]|uniref:DUF4228 domain-containing protein n=1 Tax=Cuscuta campestris TaxID=132261 RepID=A0A484N3H2_9ASTE|nr:unnamed protein product [Cuscuta campestris]